MKKILLIEDNPDDVELTLRSLKKANISNAIVFLSDGARALEYLTTQELPALVLLDLHLPKVSGLDVLKEIRDHARTKQLPIIIFTASTDQRDMIDAYSLGINGYIEKPIVFAELAQAVSRVGLTWVISDMHDACAQLKAELSGQQSDELEHAKREVDRLQADNDKLQARLHIYSQKLSALSQAEIREHTLRIDNELLHEQVGSLEADNARLRAAIPLRLDGE